MPPNEDGVLKQKKMLWPFSGVVSADTTTCTETFRLASRIHGGMTIHVNTRNMCSLSFLVYFPLAQSCSRFIETVAHRRTNKFQGNQRRETDQEQQFTRHACTCSSPNQNRGLRVLKFPETKCRVGPPKDTGRVIGHRVERIDCEYSHNLDLRGAYGVTYVLGC